MGQSAAGARAQPVLIYCPGLGKYSSNSADGVAEVLANVLDRQRPGRFAVSTLRHVTAPRGLLVGKSVLDHNDVPVLHVFELDYRRRLDPTSGPSGPAAPPGAVRSATYAVAGFAGLLAALGRPAKTRIAKWQLFYGLVAVAALALCALVAAVSWLVAAGVGSWLPHGFEHFLGLDASNVALTTGAVSVGGWALWRRKLLALAASVQRNLRYFDEQRHRQTVILTLTDAVDGLRDDGWSGPVHVLGYSFGSLVALDALFPMDAGPCSRLSGEISSLTTIGCPADAVRLYRPDYLAGRSTLVPAGFDWINVFNLADIFASNFTDGGDGIGEGQPVDVAGICPTNVRYGHEKLSTLNVLRAKGFRTHDGYWGSAEEASCFDALVGRWAPSTT
jgi:hypothetical protein